MNKQVTGEYLNYERSVSSAVPIELYHFQSVKKEYFYTSSEFPFTWKKNVFSPQPLKRGVLRYGVSRDSNRTLNVSAPSSLELIQENGFLTGAPVLILSLYRMYLGLEDSEAICIWKGPVTEIKLYQDNTVLYVQDAFSHSLKTSVPPFYYQGVCNHALYSTYCSVLRDAYASKYTIGSQNDTHFTLVGDVKPDGYFVGGEMVVNRTEERRTIVLQAGLDIRVNYLFYDVQETDVLTLYAGCDHSASTCKNKFQNLKNFGGHSFIPAENPFEGEID